MSYRMNIYSQTIIYSYSIAYNQNAIKRKGRKIFSCIYPSPPSLPIPLPPSFPPPFLPSLSPPFLPSLPPSIPSSLWYWTGPCGSVKFNFNFLVKNKMWKIQRKSMEDLKCLLKCREGPTSPILHRHQQSYYSKSRFESFSTSSSLAPNFNSTSNSY